MESAVRNHELGMSAYRPAFDPPSRQFAGAGHHGIGLVGSLRSATASTVQTLPDRSPPPPGSKERRHHVAGPARFVGYLARRKRTGAALSCPPVCAAACPGLLAMAAASTGGRRLAGTPASSGHHSGRTRRAGRRGLTGAQRQIEETTGEEEIMKAWQTEGPLPSQIRPRNAKQRAIVEDRDAPG